MFTPLITLCLHVFLAFLNVHFHFLIVIYVRRQLIKIFLVRGEKVKKERSEFVT